MLVEVFQWATVMAKRILELGDAIDCCCVVLDICQCGEFDSHLTGLLDATRFSSFLGAVREVPQTASAR